MVEYDTLCRFSKNGGGGIIFKSKWQAMTTYDSEKLKSVIKSTNKSTNKILTIYEYWWWIMQELRFLNYSNFTIYLQLK